MYEFADIHRLPRGGVDPITCRYDALRLVLFAMTSPPRHETIVLLLDRDRRGRGVLVVQATEDPDALLGVVDMVADSASRDPDAGAVVLASVRPGGGVLYDDLGRWDEADELCQVAQLDLVEWFVLGDSIGTPRHVCGAAERWAP